MEIWTTLRHHFMPIEQMETKKIIYQVLLCSLVVFVALYFINPIKAIFPTTLFAVLLLIASLLQKTTLIETIRKSGTWRILLGIIFLLIVNAKPIIQNWRENGYIVPIVFALVVTVFSLNKYLQTKISNNSKSNQV
ncbi:hypothetical protein [Microcoleus sp.]|uniref:hypothetical protein n=1 Tax=Microcoleus sp. TaxID=44472 RepID=UPI00403EE468